jgi:hypothetical protein
MRSRRILSTLGATLGLLAAQSTFSATRIDAYFGPGPGYNTLNIDVFVEQSDVTSHAVTLWSMIAYFTKNTGPAQVQNNHQTRQPPVVGLTPFYLEIGGAPPVPAASVGLWEVDAYLNMQYTGCIATIPGLPPRCGPLWFCAHYPAQEPCYDTASGQIQ